MAKGEYIGVANVARKVKQPYVSVDGVARKVKKEYIGVNGVARECYTSVKPLSSSTICTRGTLSGNGTELWTLSFSVNPTAYGLSDVVSAEFVYFSWLDWYGVKSNKTSTQVVTVSNTQYNIITYNLYFADNDGYYQSGSGTYNVDICYKITGHML